MSRRSKEAFEKQWQTTANYAFDDPRLQDHVNSGGNFGVVAGDGHVIVETDSPELQALVERELPPTFTQRSPGHHSKHFFYNGSSKIIPLFDKSKPKGKDNVGHVKSGPSYVVGPGSTHPNGGRYEIVDDLPVAAVTEQQIMSILAQFIARRGLASEKAEAKKHHAPDSFNILDLIPGLGLKERAGQLQGAHPVHGSETGMNFSVNPRENVWHCFRCNSGGGPYFLLAVLERIIECQDAVPGGLKGELFKRIRDLAVEKGLIKKQIPVLAISEEQPEISENAGASEVAEAVLRKLQVHTIFDGEMYHYEEGVYKPGGEALVRKLVESNFHRAGLDETSSNHFLSEVLGHVQRRTYVEPDIFDPDPNILNLENGLLNTETFELKPHTPNYPSLAKLPVKYDPSARSILWEKFVAEIHYPEDLNAVQEFAGSLLVRHYKTQKAMMKVGVGENGKDTESRVWIAVLGPENVAHHTLQSLEENRFAVADCYGRMANICSDLSDRALRGTGTFKNLTGEGSVTGERKFQNPFSFPNTAKMVFHANKLPLSPDDSDAFFRRWFICVYPFQFQGARRDPDLVAKLTTPEQLSSILNWMLDGVQRLRAQKWQLSNSKSVQEVRDDYVRKSDPVKAFVMDCCTAAVKGSVAKQRLYSAFVQYCRWRQLPPALADSFYKRIPAAGIPINTVKLGPKGKQVPSFTGLWLRRPENWAREAFDDEKPLLDNETLNPTIGGSTLDTPDTLDTKAPTAGSVSRVSMVSGAPPPETEATNQARQVGECDYCHRQGPLWKASDGRLRCKSCHEKFGGERAVP